MIRGFRRKAMSFLAIAILAIFASVYLHSCQSSNGPSAGTPPLSIASSQSSSSSPSPIVSPSSSECSEDDNPDCQKKPLTLDGLISAYLTLGNSYRGFIVDFNDNAPSITTIARSNNFDISDVLPNEKTYLLQGGLEELNKLKTSELAGYISYIEPNYLYRQASNVVVNDPYYPEQWDLKDINIEEAWKITQGQGITVAVLDTGIALVPDFSPSTFTAGFDFVGSPPKPINAPSHDPEVASGKNSHGTNIAGIIAQATNNSLGFAGITPESKIMPIRVLGKDGYGTAEDIAKGFEWAVANGADIINCSFAIVNENAKNEGASQMCKLG